MRAFVAHQEIGEDPARVGRPEFLLEDQVAVGWMDDPVVELLVGRGLDEDGFRLGTPDLAPASKLVADEDEHRPRGVGGGDAGKRRRNGRCEAARRQSASVDHGQKYEAASRAGKARFTAL
ncbi:MAG TPA: hypothetical protein VFB13_09420 [Reyranella sp.]|nr:hypothetical protein [Reyranella sp.]